ncbi:unnamed protein product [Acanthoscelides obtectus]|uniref:Uncharacterized protein n=1 Tax=Acanthoscelides obtectus TaxID=200917 RepID=A0A9P0M0S0_ACAOB|nr:unnamed protein product [Acanthoscelides obtectus]CAK1621620.1 hypothetical protein AOBTE_LOCUS1046 [Acanthoscelides obtectus]
MDLRTTLMVLKVEACFGGNPLMKLNRREWRISKINYALQAFYGAFLIVGTGFLVSDLLEDEFLPYGYRRSQQN